MGAFPGNKISFSALYGLVDCGISDVVSLTFVIDFVGLRMLLSISNSQLAIGYEQWAIGYCQLAIGLGRE